jgi:hypothetical protein
MIEAKTMNFIVFSWVRTAVGLCPKTHVKKSWHVLTLLHDVYELGQETILIEDEDEARQGVATAVSWARPKRCGCESCEPGRECFPRFSGSLPSTLVTELEPLKDARIDQHAAVCGRSLLQFGFSKLSLRVLRTNHPPQIPIGKFTERKPLELTECND